MTIVDEAAAGAVRRKEAGVVRRNTGQGDHKIIWRMSQANPQREWVEVSAGRRMNRPLHVAHEQSFSVSSMDLLSGMDVSETAMDTLPGDLIDAFAPPRGPDDKGS